MVAASVTGLFAGATLAFFRADLVRATFMGRFELRLGRLEELAR